MWALIDNFSADVQTETLLASTSTRRKLIDSLIADVEKYDLDGLNLDFESLKKKQVSIILNLSVNCRSRADRKGSSCRWITMFRPDITVFMI